MSVLNTFTGTPVRAAETAARHLKKLFVASLAVFATFVVHDTMKPTLEILLSKCSSFQPAVVVIAVMIVLRKKTD